MKNLKLMVMVLALLSSASVYSKTKYRKPSSTTVAVKCEIGSEKAANGMTGYYLTVDGAREDDGVFLTKSGLYLHLAELQNFGVCLKDEKLLPLPCSVEKEVKGDITAYYVSINGGSSDDSGVWINGKTNAMISLLDFQKRGVCK